MVLELRQSWFYSAWPYGPWVVRCSHYSRGTILFTPSCGNVHAKIGPCSCWQIWKAYRSQICAGCKQQDSGTITQCQQFQTQLFLSTTQLGLVSHSRKQGPCPSWPEFNFLTGSLSSPLPLYGCLSPPHRGRATLGALNWSWFLVVLSSRFK